MDNQRDKIRKFNNILNNEETSEIANFLFQLPLADLYLTHKSEKR